MLAGGWADGGGGRHFGNAAVSGTDAMVAHKLFIGSIGIVAKALARALGRALGEADDSEMV